MAIFVYAWLYSSYILGALVTLFAALSVPMLLRFRTCPRYAKIALLVGDALFLPSAILGLMAKLGGIYLYFGIGMTGELLLFTLAAAGIFLISGEWVYLKNLSKLTAVKAVLLVIGSAMLANFTVLYPLSYDFASPNYCFYTSEDGAHEVIVRENTNVLNFGFGGGVDTTKYYYEVVAPGVLHYLCNNDGTPEDYTLDGTTDETEVYYKGEYQYTVRKQYADH